MDLQVMDNFFEDPERVVSLCSQLNWFHWENHPGLGRSSGRYAGIRSNELHLIMPSFFHYASNKIANAVYNFSDKKNMVRCTWKCSMYFSSVNAKDKPSKDSPVEIIHKDVGVNQAGLIYLSKRINGGAGTSFYNSDYKRIKEAKNRYNRLICYDGSILHGTSKYVNNRLALLFFFKKVEFSYR